VSRIGPSVFHAVFSTLLAVAVIGASESYVFRIFFKVLLLTVLVGGSHGLFFLPVMLSLGGGKSHAKVENKEVTTRSPTEDCVQEIEMSKVTITSENEDVTEVDK